MSESFDIIVVDKESIDMFDAHGYLVRYRRPDLNFKSPTKRSFLNECIQHIYMLKNHSMPTIPINAVYNSYHMWNSLNELMESKEISDFQAKVDKVKRRLFQETKLRPRKINNVCRNNVIKTESLYYKHQRSELGTRKIPRNYLNDARHEIYAEMRQKLKRKHMDDDDSDYSESFHFPTDENEFQVSQQVLRKIRRCHGNMSRRQTHHAGIPMEEQIKRERNVEACRQRRTTDLGQVLLEKQYQERSEANENTLKAAIRSILYLKMLRGIILSGRAHES